MQPLEHEYCENGARSPSQTHTRTAKLGCIKEWYFSDRAPAHRRAAPSVGTLQAQQSPSNLCDSPPLSSLSRSCFAGRRGPLAVRFARLKQLRSFSTPEVRSFLLSLPAKGTICSAKDTGLVALPNQREPPCVPVMRLVAHSRHSIKGIPLCLKKPPQ